MKHELSVFAGLMRDHGRCGLKRWALALVLLVSLPLLRQPAWGQYTWTNVAGRLSGAGYQDGTGAAVRLNNPQGIVMAPSGNAYFCDSYNQVIRMVTPAGVVTTIAGTPNVYGSSGGTGMQAKFNNPSGLAQDNAGNLYVADMYNHVIRKITSGGVVTTIAGSVGVSGSTDGVGGAARFYYPKSLAWSNNGTLYVIDSNYAVRAIRVADRTVSTFAGSASTSGYLNAVGTAARFGNLGGVVALADGSLRVADKGNYCIRAIATNGTVTTVAGLAGTSGTADGTGGTGGTARFTQPTVAGVDSSGNLLVSDSGTIRRVDSSGTVTTISGLTGVYGDTNGGSAVATYRSPNNLACAADGSLWIADATNNQIRRMTADGQVTPLAGNSTQSLGSEDGQGENARFYHPNGLALDPVGILYVADCGNNTVRKISPDGTVTTLAGLAGQTGHVDATGSAARFNYPCGMCVDAGGNVIVSEYGGNDIRKITPAGEVTTLASLSNAADIVLNNDGNYYAASMGIYIYRITPGGTITNAAGGAGYDGESLPLTNNLSSPIALAVNGTGKVFFIGNDKSCLKVLNPGVSVRPLGGGTDGFADGWGGGLFDKPGSVAADADANCFIADTLNNCIRKVTRQGLASTIGGTVGMSGNGTGVGSAAKFSEPASLAVAPGGTIYVANYQTNTIVKGVLTGPEIEVYQTSATVPTSYVDSRDHRRFGVVATGHTESMRFSIRNRGAADLAEIKVTLDGTDAAEFSVVSQPLDRLGAGMETDFVVGFSPVTAGSKAAAIHIASNDLDEGVFDIYLMGTAVASAAGGPLYWRNWAGIPGTSGCLCENADESKFTDLRQLAVDPNGNVYVADAFNCIVMKISVTGQVSLVAGFAGSGGNTDGKREDARFNTPRTVVSDGNDVLYVTENYSYGGEVRRIAADGTTTTVGPGLDFDPAGMAWDSTSASLVVANTNRHTIMRMTPAGVVTTIAGTSGSPGSGDGTGTAAKFNSPAGVAVDSAGVIYVADAGNHTIRKITGGGVVTTLAGTATIAGSADGLGSAAKFNNPSAIAVDSAGNLWVADTSNNLVRRVDPAGNVTTMGGTAGTTGDGTGMGTAASFNAPSGIAVAPNGRIYVSNNGTYNIVESTSLVGDIAVDQVDGGTLVAGASIPMATAPNTSVAVNLRIRNLGSAALSAVSAAISGTDAASFALSQSPAATIDPGGETFLTVTYQPASDGTRSAALVIASSDPDQNPFVVNLSGGGMAPPPPVLTTMAAAGVTDTTATLNGSINAQNLNATVSFDYGLTTAYGNTVTASPAQVGGTTTTAVTAAIGGLNDGTTYHYRIAASHPYGAAHGDDLTFTTNARPVFAGYALNTPYQTPVTVTVADLLTAASDPNGDAVAITAAGPSSANGGSVGLQADAIIYTPPNGFSGGDSYTIVLTDARGASATGTVTVDVGQTAGNGTVVAAFHSATEVPVTAAGYNATGSTVTLALAFAPPTGTNLMVINNTALGFIEGQFTNLAQGQVVTLTYGGAIYRFVANYYGGSGNDLVLAWAGTKAFGWGYNAAGQLGNLGTNNSGVPVALTKLGAFAGKTILSQACGGSHSIALCADGSVVAWGG